MLARIRGFLVLIEFSITVTFVIIFMYIFRKNAHKVIKIWMHIQIFVLGIKLEQVGTLDESCDLVLLNHQSLLDIIVLEYLHSKHLAWVGKKEIADLFFFGHIMKAPDMIILDRENKSGLIKLLKEARIRLDKGRPIAMFPEGTRGRGDKLLKFKPGASILGNKLGLRVQAIVVINTRKILDNQPLKATSGTVKVIYLDPVLATKEEPWLKNIEEEMNDIYNKEMS